MSEITENIEHSIKTGFIDKDYYSSDLYQSKLKIMNDIDQLTYALKCNPRATF